MGNPMWMPKNCGTTCRRLFRSRHYWFRFFTATIAESLGGMFESKMIVNTRLLALALLNAAALCLPHQSSAQEIAEDLSLHGQATFVDQYHPGFRSPHRGPNSLDPGSRGEETFDATLFAGLRLWTGGELYANPEIDQGFGLSGTVGMAGFPSGEAYKIGKSDPYLRLQRLFFRQSFELGGQSQNVEPGANQLGGETTANNIVVTFGKISSVDIFDVNAFAHDPRIDFLNWSVIDAGAYDYAADSWAYTYGIAVEWTQNWWTWRTGLFDLSRVPNTTALETGFAQFEIVSEFEERHSWFGQSGKLKLLGFLNRGRMGAYRDAVAVARETGSVPDMALVRNYASRPGASLNLEQALADGLGLFARVSFNDGSKEAFEFTEINRSISLGLSLNGMRWARSGDTFGVAAAVNALSRAARSYFAAGGLGILIGDGQLPHYGYETILETYYSAELTDWLAASADYQFVINPAYASDRGPVSIFALRLHAHF